MGGFLEGDLVRRGEIGQVRGVDDDGIEVIVACSLCKCRAVHGIIGRRLPAAWITGEDLYSVAANLPGNLRGLDRPGMSGHVPSDALHSASCSCASAPGSCSRPVRPNCCKNSLVWANSAGRPTASPRPISP